MILNLLNGNTEALSLLDWPIVIGDISSISHFELTQQKLQKPLKAKKAELIQKELDVLEYFLGQYDEFNLIFNTKLRMISPTEEIFKSVNDISKGKFFEASELHFLASLAECYTENHRLFAHISISDDVAVNHDTNNKIKRLFTSPLREFVDHHGNVSYERHPLLKRLYAEVLALENDLRQTVQKVSKSDLYSSKLQLDTYDVINDRYVLAVRSDSYHSDLGPIVARSQSGMTLYVEPYEVREKGNKRIHLLSEIESTILRLTIELSKIVHGFESEFKFFRDWILELDWLNTKATYSVKKGLVKPKLNDKFKFEINGIFHPLLNSPVKNNLFLDEQKKGLIISGPNTGGKTVALKSLTLSLLMLHVGLFIPATFADIYPTENLFYFSHDHQDLSEGLSSFASESKYYLELLQELGERNLIVIDEIFNSTSSEEASALAIAFLDEVHFISQSKIVLSTHHQVLKTFMHNRSDYISAHVGYDFETNRPTYKLIIGEPGSSLAFKIFDNLSEKFGQQTQISEKAKSLLDGKQVTYESLLQELSQKKVELDRQLTQNRNLGVELRNQKSAMEGTLYLEREKILNDYTKKIKGLYAQAEKMLEDVRQEKIANRKGLSIEIGQIQSALNKETPQKSNKLDPENVYAHMKPIDFTEIAQGMTVFSLTVKKNVKVVGVNPRKKEIQIQNGALSIWVSPSTLKFPSGYKAPAPKVTINIEKKVRGDIEIDCRGMRLEEFQNISMQAIDEVITGEIPFVTIIHGHGDGVLKNWLRSYLKKEHRDLQWENIEGNDGCTKIFF